jgi:hypothetical protein
MLGAPRVDGCTPTNNSAITRWRGRGLSPLEDE